VSKQQGKTIWIIIGLLILFQPVVMDTVLAFVFAGIIPGTTLELPFWAMSLLLGLIGYIAIKWVTKETVYIGDVKQIDTQKRLAARKYVMQKINPIKAPSRRPTLRRRKRTYRVATS
jgi:hypothetical protein